MAEMGCGPACAGAKRRWRWGLLPMCVLLAGLGARAQGTAPETAPPTGQTQAGAGTASHGAHHAGMGRVAGEITAIHGPTLTLRSTDGDIVTVVTTDNTRVMKADGPVRVTDLHVGDGLMAMGNLDEAAHTLHAGLLMAEDAAQVKAMRENLGKTYITGRVTAVNLDDARMTVERPDHQAQTIGFDETTSFKRAVRPERHGDGERGAEAADGADRGEAAGRHEGSRGFGMMGDPTAAVDRAFANGESITLADIKVGDFVVGTGSLKAGTFVPTRLLDSPGRHRPGGATGQDQGAGVGNGAGQGSGPGAR